MKPRRGRPKGLPKSGGRKRGTPNKLGNGLREMILAALDKVGGQDYLVKQADENPRAFLALLGRILPLQVAGHDSGPMVIKWEEGPSPLIASFLEKLGDKGDPGAGGS